MLCNNCGVNQATTTVKQTINGQTRTLYLCPECANKLHIGFLNHPLFNTSNLFSGLFGQDGVETYTEREQRCPQCGATLRQILSTGHLGCSACVKAFQNDLTPVVRKIHGNAVHTGKVPQTASVEIKTKRQIEMLEQKLQTAIQEQYFEQAAALRDEINRLKG